MAATPVAQLRQRPRVKSCFHSSDDQKMNIYVKVDIDIFFLEHKLWK